MKASKYLGKSYGGWKVVSAHHNDSRHMAYTLTKLRKRIHLTGNQIVAVARHETTIKKLLKK